MNFNGMVNGMNDLARLSNALTRSISPENPTGEPGKGGMRKTVLISTHSSGGRILFLIKQSIHWLIRCADKVTM